MLFWAAWLLHLPLPVFLAHTLAKRDWFNSMANVLAIAASFAPRWLETRSRHRFPAPGEFALSLILAMEMYGRSYHLYEGHPSLPFDLAAHSVEVGSATFFTVLLLHAYLIEHELEYDEWFVIAVGVLIGLGIGAGWELIEWSFDPLFSSSLQHGVDDNMSDIAAGAVGSLLGGLAARWYRATHSNKEVMEEGSIFYKWL